jgi:hypothetical protein
MDLKKGSVVVIELASDGKIILKGQCAGTAPFNEDAVEYIKSLKSSCQEVDKFLQN